MLMMPTGSHITMQLKSSATDVWALGISFIFDKHVHFMPYHPNPPANGRCHIVFSIANNNYLLAVADNRTNSDHI